MLAASATSRPTLAIRHGQVLTPEGRLVVGTLLICGEHIAAVGPEDALPAAAMTLDATGLVVAPGFIDVQLNGGFGADFTETPAAMWTVGAQLPRTGVTAFLPTLITAPLERIARAQAVWQQGAPPGYLGAEPLGLHLEGPFLNPAQRGAHPRAHLRRPELALTAAWSPERGVRLATLAPELPGALALVAALAARGVVVGAGHSQATLAEMQAAFAAGLRYGTHLCNAMGALQHRDPGIVGALLADPAAVVGLIADGVHVHPQMIALVWRLVGPRLNLVTDALAALGRPPGWYRLGAQRVQVAGGAARLADGTLAGSVLTLDQAVRNLVAFTGCTLAEALRTVTATPAALLGLERGKLAPGCVADVVLLTPAGHIAATVARGRVVYQRARG